MTEKPITTTQAARLAKVSGSTILRAVIDRKIPSFKTPGGHYRLHRADVLEFFRVGNSKVREMAEELAECEALLELQRARVAEASAHWRRAVKAGKLTYPDLGELVAWLMDRAGLRYDREKCGLGKSDPKLHRAWRKKWARRQR